MTSRSNGPLDESPTHLLHRMAQRIGEIFETEQGKADLTPRQISVLATIERNEGLSQTGLVNLTAIDRSTLADIVRRLQRKGLVQRRRTKEDARAYAVKLTEEGRRVVRAAEPILRRVDERILSPLGAKDRAKFIADMKTVISALGPSPSPTK
jgi:MarR family transcriptional regulator, temperature-dependent positive regulator of motility